MNTKITATSHNTPNKIMTNHDLEKLVETGMIGLNQEQVLCKACSID